MTLMMFDGGCNALCAPAVITSTVSKMSQALPVVSSKKRKKEQPGTVIFCGQTKYVIESLLGAGGMGDVYKLHLAKDKTQIFAMKTERIGVNEAYKARLKVELNVFEAIQSAPDAAIDKSHFVRMYARGKTADFKFFIMDVVGPNLRDVYVKMLRDTMQDYCVNAVARQTLKALESLHEVGWLHRDIKPANYSIGLPPRDNILYMMDFGAARKYREEDGKLKIPRTRSISPGTLLYCSVRCHEHQEQSRRDDLESWVYMMIELYWTGNITWWTFGKDKAKLVEHKSVILDTPRELYARKALRVPKPFLSIIEFIAAMNFTDGADFPEFIRHLDEMVVEEKLDMSKPLEWVGRTMPTTPEKPKGGSRE